MKITLFYYNLFIVYIYILMVTIMITGCSYLKILRCNISLKFVVLLREIKTEYMKNNSNNNKYTT